MPPLNTLRVFEAAGRYESFKEAADELHVTPSAVSHQIRLLEEWVGAPLFERSVRQVSLTPVGRILAREMTTGFDQIHDGLTRAKGHSIDSKLKVSALPLLTNAWLIPRLARFEAKYPDVLIDIETTNRVVAVDQGEADIAIRNTRGPAHGLKSKKLLELSAMPVCTKDVAKKMRSPEDLAKMTLIHNSYRLDGWPEWLKAAGLQDLKPKGNLSFDTLTTALEATAAGKGVMLGLLPIIWDAPAAEHLVVPFDKPSLGAGTYFVVCRKQDQSRALVRDFVNWLCDEMRSDFHRLSARTNKKIAPSL